MRPLFILRIQVGGHISGLFCCVGPRFVIHVSCQDQSFTLLHLGP